jgi:hypothetical protein
MNGPDGRDFLKGIDFGLRHKMTTGLRFVAGRSLYTEPDGFWQDLSASYGLRNKIIHDGQIAHEDDAKLAIKVARKRPILRRPSRSGISTCNVA